MTSISRPDALEFFVLQKNLRVTLGGEVGGELRVEVFFFKKKQQQRYETIFKDPKNMENGWILMIFKCNQ